MLADEDCSIKIIYVDIYVVTGVSYQDIFSAELPIIEVTDWELPIPPICQSLY